MCIRDRSRVLVTKFRQNRSTLKGRNAGQRHTDRQTDNSAENKGPSGFAIGPTDHATPSTAMGLIYVRNTAMQRLQPNNNCSFVFIWTLDMVYIMSLYRYAMCLLNIHYTVTIFIDIAIYRIQLDNWTITVHRFCFVVIMLLRWLVITFHLSFFIWMNTTLPV